MRMGVCAAAIITLTVAPVLAGCGSDGPATTVGVADTINYGSFGTTADINCANGKALNVGGSNNTLTVSGTCAAVTVGGADNTIRLDRVDGELVVDGLNNTISYKSGDPAVNDEGSGNTINGG